MLASLACGEQYGYSNNTEIVVTNSSYLQQNSELILCDSLETNMTSKR